MAFSYNSNINIKKRTLRFWKKNLYQFCNIRVSQKKFDHNVKRYHVIASAISNLKNIALIENDKNFFNGNQLN